MLSSHLMKDLYPLYLDTCFCLSKYRADKGGPSMPHDCPSVTCSKLSRLFTYIWYYIEYSERLAHYMVSRADLPEDSLISDPYIILSTCSGASTGCEGRRRGPRGGAVYLQLFYCNKYFELRHLSTSSRLCRLMS